MLPIDTNNNNNLQTILSHDVLVTQDNLVIHSLLEYRSDSGIYNIYFQISQYLTQAPAFITPVVNFTNTDNNNNLVCLQIKILDPNNLVVSCFNNQTSQQKNIFQIINRNGSITPF